MSYWGLNDGLTISAVSPHLQLLQARPDVAAVRLVTIERGPDAQGALAFEPGFAAGKISFESLRSRLSGNVILNKIEAFTRFPKELIRQIAGFKPDFIIARGAPAGALVYLFWQKTKLPFYVESFESHADYMRESGVWRAHDPRYLFQRHWEKRPPAAGPGPVAGGRELPSAAHHERRARGPRCNGALLGRCRGVCVRRGCRPAGAPAPGL